jgi:hypothetical protein
MNVIWNDILIFLPRQKLFLIKPIIENMGEKQAANCVEK